MNIRGTVIVKVGDYLKTWAPLPEVRKRELLLRIERVLDGRQSSGDERPEDAIGAAHHSADRGVSAVSPNSAASGSRPVSKDDF